MARGDARASRVATVGGSGAAVLAVLCVGGCTAYAHATSGVASSATICRKPSGACPGACLVALAPGMSGFGPLRLRGAGQLGKGKRRYEAAESTEEADGDGGTVRTKRSALSGGLVGSVLSASYAAAAAPLNLAYNVCASAMVMPFAAFRWMMPPAKRHYTDEEMLHFSGDEDKPAAIRRQIEFYFSDSNLPFDAFLKSEIAKDADGRVSLAVIASFKRMRILEASVDDIAAAARTIAFLEVSADGCFVRRTTPIPEADVTLARTVYAHPFKVETFGEAMSLVTDIFAAAGQVSSVRLVRDFRDRQPTGAVFVEFAEASMAEAACGMDFVCPQTGAKIKVCMKREWKRLDRARRLQEKKDQWRQDAAPVKGKKALAQDLSAPNTKHKVWVRVTDLDPSVQWRDVSRAFARYGVIKYVDMHANNRSATVRFGRAQDAISASADNETPSICGSTPQVWLVSGEEEEHENEKFKRRSKVPPLPALDSLRNVFKC